MSALYSSHSSRRLLLEQRAHNMGFHPTHTEALLWSRLRAQQLGVTFQRQVVIGQFTVDFTALAAKFVVEVDGDIYHEPRSTAGARREGKLRKAGFCVVRLPASLVVGRLQEAVALVVVALRAG